MQVIPCDPHAGYLAQKREIDDAIRGVMERGWYILGSEVEAFEQEFAAFVGTDHAVGVGNGTDAICLGLRALGLGVGDAALTVSHTAVATVAAIEMAGLTPVFVDVDPRTYTMCPDSVEKAIQNSGSLAKSLKAIVPVHLYGHPANMTAIRDIACRHGLKILEDCAQSHGATVDGLCVGSIGHVGAFSLYPTKNLGAFGDAGIITTNDAAVADSLRMLRQYGWQNRTNSEIPGFNSRLDEMQAAILRVRLRHLDSMNDARRRIANVYESELTDSHCFCPIEAAGTKHVYHQYVIRCQQRNAVQQALKQFGVSALIHYSKPVHTQSAYQNRIQRIVELPHTEALIPQILSMPMYPELPEEHVSHVIASLRKALSA